MGYFINEKIAKVNTLNKVTLAHNPQFLQFTSANESSGTKQSLILQIDTSEVPVIDANTDLNLVFTENGNKHTFKASTDKKEVSNQSFVLVKAGDTINESGEKASVNSANAITAQNLYNCLMQNTYFKSNFEITTSINFTQLDENEDDTYYISLTAKGFGKNYNFSYILPDSGFIKIRSASANSVQQYDTIDYNTGNYKIELDIYTHTGVFLGENDDFHESRQGKYLTTLSKAYHKDNIWFDINTLFSRKTSYSDAFIKTDQWCDTGTVDDFRIIGRRSDGIMHDLFYSSEVLYVVNGYDYTLHTNDLNTYILDVSNFAGEYVKPLSNSPPVRHVKGQKHYFNFILQNSLHNYLTIKQELKIGLLYRFYTQSHEYISEVVSKEQNVRNFNIVNTIETGIDNLIEKAEQESGKKVGRVEVMLALDKTQVSHPLTYLVDYQESIAAYDFAFLNRLGGWDSFNFGNDKSVEFKSTSETYYRTLLPGYKIYDKIESVNKKNINEKFSIKSLPIKKETADWLRELSSSTAVYELATKRYIVVDEMTLKYNPVDDLFIVEMKYHYTDSLNGSLQSSK